MEKPFEPGDVITFCDEDFFVIDNHGSSGNVCPVGENYYLGSFYWEFQGEKCTFKRKATEHELFKLGMKEI